MNDKNELVRKELLEFYYELPFNKASGPEVAAQDIKQANTLGYYFGPYESLFNRERTVLEIGCGVGWMSNMINYYHQSPIVGLDFNPTAIKSAKEIAKSLAPAKDGEKGAEFVVADIFEYDNEPYDIVLSIGVLNHIGYFTQGVTRACQLTKDSGHVIIGLYHKHGRAPFLNHFSKLKAEGYSEEQLFEEYRKLDSRHQDETLARSWFHDQVYNVHETQHTLEELNKVFHANNVRIIGTSINNFGEISNIEDICKMEPALYDKGMRYLSESVYFPGFFITVGVKE